MLNRNKFNLIHTHWIGLFIAFIPSLLLYAKLRNGITLSPDSLTYLFAARGLLDKGELLNLYGDTNLTLFPPLYPFFLALIQTLGFSGEAAAKMISIGAMAVSVFISYMCIKKISNNIAVAGIFSLLIFAHPQMQGVFMFAYSESIFIVLLCLLLFLLFQLNQNNLNKISIFIGFLIGLAFLTRYGAIAIIPAVLCGLIPINSINLRKKIIACSLVLFSCFIIIGAWLLRNYFIDGTLFGPRIESEDTIMFALRRIVLVTTEWLSPFYTKKKLKLGLGITFILVFGLLSTLFLYKSKFKSPALTASFVFVIIHAVLMIYTQIRTVVDPIDSRYLSPVIVPIIFTLIGSFYFFSEKLAFNPTKLGVGIGILFLSFHGSQSFLQIHIVRAGYSNFAVQHEDLPAECFDDGILIYSNDFPYLRYQQIFPHAKELPRQFIYRRTIRRDDWEPFITSLQSTTAYIIWFKYNLTSNPTDEDLLGGSSETVNIELIEANDLYNVYRTSFIKEVSNIVEY